MLDTRVLALHQRVKQKALLKYAVIGINCLLLAWLLSIVISRLMHVTITPFSFLIALLVWVVWLWLRRPLAQYSLHNLLLHANQSLPSMQQSAHLLACADASLDLLKRLQKQRITNVVSEHWEVFAQTAMDTVRLRTTVVTAALIILSTIAINKIPLLNVKALPVAEIVNKAQPSSSPLTYTFALKVQPPAYTGLAATASGAGNLSIVEGSSVTWQVVGSQPITAFDYFVQIGSERLAMQAASAQELSVQHNVTRSTVYHFNHEEQAISDVFSLEVLRDQRPRVQIQAPQHSVTQFVQDSLPVVSADVLVSDDFGLSKVYIEASIAKGSGEAVKFRDEIFEFDTVTPVVTEAAGITYNYMKQWSLIDLGMEPGDEFYFTVIAWDNKQPQAQEARSETRIIRWLDENVAGITSEGIVIDFMPEYFKSQRQIIIETNALIEQREQLAKSEFDKLSRALGMAQSDLKHRYGQYLGDEFESGVMQTMEQGPTQEHHEHEHADEDDAEQASDQHSHTHESSVTGTPSNADRSGFTEVIEQFGHDHGEVDVGFISLRKGEFSPKVLMKQSIANMWQAELFLLLSEPERALPFEEKALDFLNRAKQADRVYVQRLGFEPPPVSEERRYQGDLSDIPSLSQKQELELTNNGESRVRELLFRLNQVTVFAIDTMSPDDKQLLHDVGGDLQQSLELSEQDQLEAGTVLRALTNIQRMLVTGEWQSRSCSDCAMQLEHALYQWLEPLNAPPRSSSQQDKSTHPLVQRYQALEVSQ